MLTRGKVYQYRVEMGGRDGTLIGSKAGVFGVGTSGSQLPPLIEALLDAYPRFVRVGELPHPPMEDLEDKVGVVEALFREGFVTIGEEKDMLSQLQEDGAAAPMEEDGEP